MLQLTTYVCRTSYLPKLASCHLLCLPLSLHLNVSPDELALGHAQASRTYVRTLETQEMDGIMPRFEKG